MEITKRQQDVLVSIIEQYAEVAAPVGSVSLSKIFKVSPATIRAEMAALEDAGYIHQPYTSAGRVPTDKGYRFFVNGIKQETSWAPETTQDPGHESRSVVALRTRVESAGLPERMIKNAVDTLVELTDNLGLATIGSQLYLSGLSNLFNQPEFSGGDHVRDVAQLLDNLEPWLREAAPNQPLSVFIGQENPIGASSGCSLIVSKFRSPYSDQSYVGVLGSTRQNYRENMNLVRQTGLLLEKIIN